MDESVYLDEDIPFVESGDYEIDEANGVTHGGSTNLSHGNMSSLNHSTNQFHDESMWISNSTGKRGRRPKSTPLVVANTFNSKTEPKRRGRRPKQDRIATTTSDKSNELLMTMTDQKLQRRTTMGNKNCRRMKTDEQQHLIAGKSTY